MWAFVVDVTVLGAGALIGIKLGMISAPILVGVLSGIAYDQVFS